MSHKMKLLKSGRIIIFIMIMLLTLGWINITGVDHFANVKAKQLKTEDNFTTTVIISIKDQQSKIPISGAECTLYLESGIGEWEAIQIQETDNNGTIQFIIEKAGNYQIKETVAAVGYRRSNTPASFQITIADANKKKTLPDIQDEKLPEIYANIRLTHSQFIETNNQAPIEGAIFDLYAQAGPTPDLTKDSLIIENVITDSNGQFTTIGNELIRADNGTPIAEGLGMGTYYFYQKSASVISYLNPMNRIFHFIIKDSDNGNTVMVAAVNEPYQSVINIVHQDEQTQAAIAGAVFVLNYRLSTEAPWVAVTEGTTNNLGQLTIPITQKGMYQIVEASAAIGYQHQLRAIKEFELTDLDCDTTKYFSINSAKQNSSSYPTIATANVLLENYCVEINQEQVPLKDGVFELYRQTGEVANRKVDQRILKDIHTNELGQYLINRDNRLREDNGQAISQGLEPGNYYFYENSDLADVYRNPNGRITQFQIFEGEGGCLVNVLVQNERYRAKVTVEKKDEQSGKPIKDTEFILSYQEDNHYQMIHQGKTDKDGMVTFQLTKKGSYQISEITPSPGYKKNITLSKEFNRTNSHFNTTKRIKDIGTMNEIDVAIRYEHNNMFVEGTQIEVIDADNGQTAITIDGLNMVWSSLSEEHNIKGIPPGSYYISIKQPIAGYIKPTDIPFEVDQSGIIRENGSWSNGEFQFTIRSSTMSSDELPMQTDANNVIVIFIVILLGTILLALGIVWMIFHKRQE
jgi:uncharacterized surface anchored protein